MAILAVLHRGLGLKDLLESSHMLIKIVKSSLKAKKSKLKMGHWLESFISKLSSHVRNIQGLLHNADSVDF